MAGEDPTGDRSIVRFEPNERVDLPDMKAVQDNARSESRLLVHNFLFGHGGMGTPNAIDLTANGWVGVRSAVSAASPAVLSGGLPDETTNHSKGGLCNFIQVKFSGADVTVNVKSFPETFPLDPGGPQTGGFAGVALDDATIELGFAAGCEGDDSQTLSMTALAAGDYGVYFGGVSDAGQPQTRLFWNANAAAEDPQAMDTRKIAGWNARIELLSAGPPSDAYQLIHVIEWDGAAFTATRIWQNNVFEGITGATAPYTAATGWGEDGSIGTSQYGFRSNYRNINGIACWQDWAALVRAQLRDIIGDAEGTGNPYGHWTTLPEFTGAGGSVGWVGQRASLTHAHAHIEDASNPHGSVLAQSTLNVSNTLNVSSGLFLAQEVTLEANTVSIRAGTVDAPHGVEIASDMVMDNQKILATGTTSLRCWNALAGETIADADSSWSAFGCVSWVCGGEYIVAGSDEHSNYNLVDLDFVHGSGTTRGGTAYQTDHSSSTNQERLHLPLEAQVPLSTGRGDPGMLLERVIVYAYSNPIWAGGTANTLNISFKQRNMALASGQYWETLQSQNFDQGNGGVTGDIDRPPGVGLGPAILTFDLTGLPVADRTIGGNAGGNAFEHELQVRLRGNGLTTLSAYFVGVMIQWKRGTIF